MEKNNNPEHIQEYIDQMEELTPFIKKLRLRKNENHGELYLLEVYPWLEVWVFDLSLSKMDMSFSEERNLCMINYCFSGRYELLMHNGAYAYVEKGISSIETAPFTGKVIFPNERYQGMEILIDMNLASKEVLSLWRDFGVDIIELYRQSKGNKKAWLMRLGNEFDREVQDMAAEIINADKGIEEYRFLLLEHLFKFQKNRRTGREFKLHYLTPGQRAVAMRTEELITGDLKIRYVIKELAKKEGISASALKKFFTQLYGKPISEYLKDRRLDEAKKLLTRTTMTIADISIRVGYENQGKFASMFRKEVGVIPTEYRRLNYGYSGGEEEDEKII